jgi:hypothetical protein
MGILMPFLTISHLYRHVFLLRLQEKTIKLSESLTSFFLPTKFRFILALRFQRRRLLKIGQSETRPLTFQVCYRHFNKKLRVQLVLCVQISSLNTLLRMEGNICIIRLKHNQVLLFK